MSKIMYEPRRFTPVARTVVDQAEAILQEYARQGYKMDLRGLYYQFIRRNLFPESRAFLVPGNTEPTKNVLKNYKWLTDLITDGRVSGLVDWDIIEDTTRETQGGDWGYDSPADRIALVPDGYTITKWDDQEKYTEVWVEKNALLGIVSRAANRWNVVSLACRGNPSTSAVHEAARRLRRIEREGRETSIIYLGDLDPTGADIDRDVQDRLALFGSRCVVDRIALNMDQITPDLPPSPVKATDSRTNGYRDRFGTDECWELDAMEPAVMDALVEEAILARLDLPLYRARERQEEHDRLELRALADNWPLVRDYLDTEGLIPEPPDEEEDPE